MSLEALRALGWSQEEEPPLRYFRMRFLDPADSYLEVNLAVRLDGLWLLDVRLVTGGLTRWWQALKSGSDEVVLAAEGNRELDRLEAAWRLGWRA